MPLPPIQRTIHAYFAAIRAQDREAWVRCFEETACTHDPVGMPPVVGHAGLRQFFDTIVGLTTAVALMEEEVYVCGDEAAIKWTGRGLAKKTGEPFMFDGIDVMRFAPDGRIREVRAYWDAPRLFAQLT